MPRLIVTYDEFPYGGVMYRKGQTFDASEHDAKLIVGFGKASMISDERGRYGVDGPGPHPEGVDLMPRKKRSYRRRDMKADK